MGVLGIISASGPKYLYQPARRHGTRSEFAAVSRVYRNLIGGCTAVHCRLRTLTSHVRHRR